MRINGRFAESTVRVGQESFTKLDDNRQFFVFPDTLISLFPETIHSSHHTSGPTILFGERSSSQWGRLGLYIMCMRDGRLCGKLALNRNVRPFPFCPEKGGTLYLRASQCPGSVVYRSDKEDRGKRNGSFFFVAANNLRRRRYTLAHTHTHTRTVNTSYTGEIRVCDFLPGTSRW